MIVAPPVPVPIECDPSSSNRERIEKPFLAPRPDPVLTPGFYLSMKLSNNISSMEKSIIFKCSLTFSHSNHLQIFISCNLNQSHQSADIQTLSNSHFFFIIGAFPPKLTSIHSDDCCSTSSRSHRMRSFQLESTTNWEAISCSQPDAVVRTLSVNETVKNI